MAGSRTLQLVEWDKDYQIENAAKGILNAAQTPYNVTADGGARENSDGLDRALQDAYDYNRRVVLPGDSAGREIPFGKGIRKVTEADPYSGLGGVGGGGKETRVFCFSLEGVAVNGNYPVLVVPDGVDLEDFNVGLMTAGNVPQDSVVPIEVGAGYAMMTFVHNEPTSGFVRASWTSIPGGNFGGVVRNITFKTGANPGLCGFQSAGAQAWMIAHSVFDATGGLCGLMNPPGSGGFTVQCEFIGGEVGVYCENYRPTPNMYACKFSGQTRCGIYLIGCRNGINLWGNDFDMPAGVPAVYCPDTITELDGTVNPRNNGEHFAIMNLYMLNNRIHMADATPAIDVFDSAVHILDSWIDAAVISNTGKRSGTELEITGSLGQWSRVPEYHAFPNSVGNEVYVQGVRQSQLLNHDVLPQSIETPDTPFTFEELTDVYGLRDEHRFPIWEDEDACVFLDDEHGTGKRHDPYFDNGAALNTLIANQQDPQHPDFAKLIVIGWGIFYCTTQVACRPGTKIRGVGTSQSWLHWSTEKRMNDTAESLVLVPEDEANTVFLQDFGIQIFEPKHLSQTGEMITRADLRDHKYAIALEVLGSVNLAAVQATRYEFYGAFNQSFDVFNYQKLVFAHRRASGIMRGISCDMSDAWDVPVDEGSQIQIGPLNAARYRLIGDFNGEGLQGAAQIGLDQAHDSILQLKTEAGINVGPRNGQRLIEPSMLIKNTRGHILMSVSGNMPTTHGGDDLWDDALFLVEGACPGLLMQGLDRTRGSDGTKSFVRVYEPTVLPPPTEPPDPGDPNNELQNQYLKVPVITTGRVHYPDGNVASIQNACRDARAGDIVAIPAGTYPNIQFDFSNAGASLSNPVAVVPKGDGDVIITRSGTNVYGAGVMLFGMLFQRNRENAQGSRQLRLRGSEQVVAYCRFEQSFEIAIEFINTTFEPLIHRCWFVGLGVDTGDQGLMIKSGTGSNKYIGGRIELCRFFNAFASRGSLLSGKGRGTKFIMNTAEGINKDISIRNAAEVTVAYCKGARNISVQGPDHTILNCEVEEEIQVRSGNESGDIDPPDYEPWPEGGGQTYLSSHNTRIENCDGALIIGQSSFANTDPAKFRPDNIVVAGHTGGISYENNAPQASIVQPLAPKIAIPTIGTDDVYLTAYNDHAEAPDLLSGDPTPPPPPPTDTTGLFEQPRPAQRTETANPSNYESKINNAAPGTDILLEAGTYSNMTATGKGRADNPVIIRPINPDNVIFRGRHKYYGRGLQWWGINFDDANQNGGGSRHMRIYAEDSGCYYMTFQRTGGIDIEAANRQALRIRVHRCHGFNKNNAAGANGAEFFKMGGNYFEGTSAGLVADYNKVDGYAPPGEGEAFSVKCDGAIIKGNHLTGAVRDISLRNANFCLVTENNTTDDIRVNGRGHRIHNNVATRITLMKSGGTSNGYPRSEDCEISDNTAILRIGVDAPTGGTVDPRNNIWDDHVGEVKLSSAAARLNNREANLNITKATPVTLQNGDVGVAGYKRHVL